MDRSMIASTDGVNGTQSETIMVWRSVCIAMLFAEPAPVRPSIYVMSSLPDRLLTGLPVRA